MNILLQSMNKSFIQIIQWFPDDPSLETEESSETWYSVGIHPCHLQNLHSESLTTISALASSRQTVAIGETGLDKTCGSDLELQKLVFKKLALIAEQVQKPLIIHCVKAWQELIAIHRELHPSNDWIIHGFRGKPELAQSLLKEGFYLSFGALFNPASLQITPVERLCIETDENTSMLEAIYEKVASVKGLSVSMLSQQANIPFHSLRPTGSDIFIDAHTHLSLK